MTFLLTNDDGIDAPGLAALAELMADLPHWIVAPRHPHSGCGHQVTTQRPLSLEVFGSRRYAVHGTPADCTRLAIAQLCPEAPHWVLSGINPGGNLGVDVYTSGTVAAVREAAYQGIPGIALSQYLQGRQPLNWTITQAWAGKVMAHLLKHPPEPGHFWNVNLPWPGPDATVEALPDLVFCKPSRDPLPLVYQRQGSEGGLAHRSDDGSDDGLDSLTEFVYVGRYGDRPAAPGTDVAVCFSGAIAITHLSS